MNTFTAEKLGEVLAFAAVGTDTMRKTEAALRTVFDRKILKESRDSLKDLHGEIVLFARQQKVRDEVAKESKKAEAKLTKMRDTYIGKNWDEASEVLEWLGFYTGASLVHWKLISGAAQKMKSSQLTALSRKAIRFYGTLFVTDEKILKKIGASEA